MTAIAIHVTAATAIAILVTAATAIYVTAATAIYVTAVHVSVVVVHLSAVPVSAVVHLSAVLVSAVVHLSAVLVSAVHVSAVHVSVVNASAVHVSALHVLAVYDPNGAVAVVHNQNVGVALGLVLTALTALKRCHAVDIVAFFNVLHAQIVLAAAGDAALVLNVQRYAFVLVVKNPVATLAAYVTRIFPQFHMDALFFNMQLFLLQFSFFWRFLRVMNSF